MLLIFLVECTLLDFARFMRFNPRIDISTSYVDHLHAEPSAPSSPAPTLRRLPSAPNLHHHCITDSSLPTPLSEETPLLTDTAHTTPASIRHPPQHYLSSLMLNSPRHSRSSESFYVINDLVHHVNNGEYQLIGGRGGCVCVCVCPAGGENGTKPGAVAIPMHEDPPEEQPPRIGRKRQVVGILVSFSSCFSSCYLRYSLGAATGHYDPFACHRVNPCHHPRVRVYLARYRHLLSPAFRRSQSWHTYRSTAPILARRYNAQLARAHSELSLWHHHARRDGAGHGGVFLIVACADAAYARLNVRDIGGHAHLRCDC